MVWSLENSSSRSVQRIWCQLKKRPIWKLDWDHNDLESLKPVVLPPVVGWPDDRSEEGRTMEYFWIVLSVVLALVSLGFSGLFTLGFVLASFLSGAFCILYGISFSPKLSSLAEILTTRTRHLFEPKRLRVSISDSEDACYTSSGLSISGSDTIDLQLNEIVGYIFRDFVYSWHFRLTHSKSFPIQLQETTQFAMTTLCKKIKEVDWMPFLTTR